MPYLNYNLPFHRTGFRPYNTTNTWSATQLSGLGARQIFSEGGGRRLLGQIQRGFSPVQLRGLGQAPAVCLDQNENSVACADPNCTWGDCGSSGPQITVGALCLDQAENQIACTDPNCTHGDCVSAGTQKPATLGPGPSPRVAVPTSLFPQTATPSAVPAGYYGAGVVPTSSLWTQLTQSQLIPGLPNLLLFGGLIVMFSIRGSGSGGGGRRR